MRYPQWATPVRRDYLVRLFQASGNRCLLGHRVCPHLDHYIRWERRLDKVHYKVEQVKRRDSDGEVMLGRDGKPMTLEVLREVGREYSYIGHTSRLYEDLSERFIAYWKETDRQDRTSQWKEERRRIHWVPDRRGWKRRFDPVERERFLQARPEFYLEGVGVDALTLTRRAKVRVPSTHIRLLVDVTAVRIPSKNACRKARRYGKARQESIEKLCSEAVRDWWK